jgi:rod shape determining protein RodA
MTARTATLPFPWAMPLLVLALIALGLLFVQSSTAGTRLDGLEGRQLQMVLASLPILVAFAAFGHRRLARNAWLFYATGLLALVAVLFFGVNSNGARRWFTGPMGFLVQPSEVMKPLLVLALARWLQFREIPDRLRDLAVPLLLAAAPAALVKIEPDLGTALLYVPILAAMLWAAGARKRFFAGALLVVAVAAPAAYFSPFLADFQKKRIATFLTSVREKSGEVDDARRAASNAPSEGERMREAARADALQAELSDLKRGEGYQSHCAQTSIGSGGWLGKGLGQGPQNRLEYLPARHTDFVFAVIAEEWGFAGSCGVLLLFCLLGLSFLSVAAGTRDRFSRLVCVGAAACLVPQAFANIAMASGLMPVTGIPLPFVSHGGSSLFASFALLGMVVAAARSQRNHEPFSYPSADPPDPFAARVAAEPVRDAAYGRGPAL